MLPAPVSEFFNLAAMTSIDHVIFHQFFKLPHDRHVVKLFLFEVDETQLRFWNLVECQLDTLGLHVKFTFKPFTRCWISIKIKKMGSGVDSVAEVLGSMNNTTPVVLLLRPSLTMAGLHLRFPLPPAIAGHGWGAYPLPPPPVIAGRAARIPLVFTLEDVGAYRWTMVTLCLR